MIENKNIKLDLGVTDKWLHTRDKNSVGFANLISTLSFDLDNFRSPF